MVVACAGALVMLLAACSRQTEVAIHANDAGSCAFVAYSQTRVFGQPFAYADGKAQSMSCRDTRVLSDVTVLCDCSGVSAR